MRRTSYQRVPCPDCGQTVRRYLNGTYSYHIANNIRCDPSFVYDPLHTDEHTEQVMVVRWARMHQHKYPCLKWLYCNMNGIPLAGSKKKRGEIINYMKEEGMVRGILDLFLPYPHRGYHGFYLEMKKFGGVESDDQRAFRTYATEQGYYASVYYGHKSAIEALLWYLS